MTDLILPGVRLAVRTRSGGLCEGCGLLQAEEMHHRIFRRREGSTHTPANLLDLCGWGNHSGCHGVAHSPEGEALGWAVRSGKVAAEVPVAYRGRWARLDDLGLIYWERPTVEGVAS